jgi:protein TonB
MDYAQQQRNPTKHLVGIAVVVLLHVVVVYALMTGLARKVVEVIKQPIETKIIEEVKPPPPPEIPLPPPPKFQAPPPPYIPPPEVTVQTPPPQQPTITVTTEKPIEPPAPAAPVVVQEAPRPAPAAPPAATVGVVCPNYRQVLAEIPYPREAQRDGINGEVVIEFVVGANGKVRDVAVVRSSNRIFNRVSVNAVSQLQCASQGQDVKLIVPVGFKLSD